jgi:hypothetical protein
VLVVEQLDDHERAGQAHASGQVDEGEVATRVAHADQIEEPEPEADADGDLQRARDQHRRPCRSELLEVDLETDDEEQEDQADLGDRGDAGLVGHQVESVRADDHAGQEVRKDQRLAQSPADEREDGGRANADADAGKKVGGRVHRPSPRDAEFQRA